MQNISQVQGHLSSAQNAANDPDLEKTLEFGALVEKLGISLQVRDQNHKMLAGKFISVEELLHSPEFLSRLNQTLYLSDATKTNWIKLAIKKGRIDSFSITLSMKIRGATLYKQRDGNTDILHVRYTGGADSKDVTTALPLSDFRPERVPKYFPHVAGETMHDPKEVGKLICFILSSYINNPNPQATQYYWKKQGFMTFASGKTQKIQLNPAYIIPAPVQYYVPKGLICRHNPCADNDNSAEEVTLLLAPIFKEKKQCLIALLIRNTSLFLFLFATKGIYANNVFIVKLPPGFPIHLMISFFKNTNYTSLDASPIGPNIKPLRFDLETVNDGIVVTIDTFAADQVRKAEKGYDLLIQDVCGAMGSSSENHHIIALISGYADRYIPRDKCCVLELDDNVAMYNPSYIKSTLKCSDASLIRKIEREFNEGDLFKSFSGHLTDIQTHLPKTIPSSKQTTYIMLITVLRLHREFYSELFPPDFEKSIEEWLASKEQERQPLHDLICSEYCEILNKKIVDGYFKFTPKQPVTLVDKGSHTIVVDRAERCIYIETADDQDIAANDMKCINDTDSLTAALYNNDYLPHTSRDEKSVRESLNKSPFQSAVEGNIRPLPH